LLVDTAYTSGIYKKAARIAQSAKKSVEYGVGVGLAGSLSWSCGPRILQLARNPGAWLGAVKNG
jgi:hypothetical protein